MAVTTGQRAMRRRPQSEQFSLVLHSLVVLSRFPAVPLFLGYVVYALLGTGLFGSMTVFSIRGTAVLTLRRQLNF